MFCMLKSISYIRGGIQVRISLVLVYLFKIRIVLKSNDVCIGIERANVPQVLLEGSQSMSQAYQIQIIFSSLCPAHFPVHTGSGFCFHQHISFFLSLYLLLIFGFRSTRILLPSHIADFTGGSFWPCALRCPVIEDIPGPEPTESRENSVCPELCS
jgi:hypothetical protein